MQTPRRVVVVGGGLAGGTVAAALRENDFDGAITVLTNQQHPPYELPPLSKDLLLGKTEEPDWVRPAGFWADYDITLKTGTDVTGLDLDSAAVTDSGGQSYGYDALVLATGSRPNTLSVPGIELGNIHTLRTLDEAIELRNALTEGTRVVVVGAGWIGCEVASAAREHGAEVSVVDPTGGPLITVLGRKISDVFRALHEEHGVRFHFNVSAEGFDGDGGKVASVQLDDGTEIPADHVVLAVGASPRVDLAQAAGLELADKGVAVDATLLSSAPNVYAIGDIAAEQHPRYGRIRVEHWANAKNQGEYLAGRLLGDSGEYTRTPYFFTDQYDLGCEYRGLAKPDEDELRVEGSLEDRDFTAFWLRDGKVQAAMNVNQWDDTDRLADLVDNEKPLS